MQKILKEENKSLIFIFLFISLTLICLPRFDRADHGIIKRFVGNEELFEGLPYDILIYVRYIEYFRTGIGEEKIHPPYTYRPFVPYIASLLPFSAMTSLNLINLIFLYLGLICLYLTLKRLKLNFHLVILGCLLYIFSFPTFYYATSGYIDGTLIGLLTIGVYFTISRYWILLVLLILIGTFANEKIIILLPFIIFYLYINKINFLTSFLISVILFLSYFAATYVIRTFTPSSNYNYIWIPGSLYIFQNIYRPKTYLSFIITFGLPGLLMLISLIKFSRQEIKKYLYFYIGCITSIALYIYSIFAAWSDGRTIWTIYPFAIPIAMIYLNSRIRVNSK